MRNNLSKLGNLLGVTFVLFSSLRYYILVPDLDKLIAYGIIGFLVIAVSILYDRQRRHDLEITAMGDFLSDISKKSTSKTN